MIESISNQVIMWKIAATAFGIFLPLILLFVWIKKTKSKRKPALIGAITFVLFALILEGIPKYILFGGTTSISKYVWSHAYTYVALGCLLAGLFEEVGRYVAFRFFLKDYTNKRDAITYGIGHGGIEAILILGIGSISSIAMVMTINNGGFQETISSLSSMQVQSVQLQVKALASFGLFQMLLSVLERISAMILHITLSIVVFKSVREKNIYYLLIAIWLHIIFDIPAALYQYGIISLSVGEIWLIAGALTCVMYTKGIYERLKQ